ncbi:agamous-like MADS-box protein AGL29 [Lycium barbarum]|uniref:agamous-like MADS-box protein AGL29 n=1 Tax=Lycium barbarum TaxID=112863 RepID=UPI00293F5AA1|nr:agamous-like MADS-box protein AGL29 [Lycium barbarum]
MFLIILLISLALENKNTIDRQAISMKKVEKKDDQNATFLKHRRGLYKKASKLVTECNVDIGIVMLSPTSKPFSFFHPTTDVVVSRFLNPNMQLSESTCLVAAHARNRVNQLNNRLKELDSIEEAAIAQTILYDQVTETRQRGRWESIEQLNANEVTKFEAWLNTASSNMYCRLKELENGVSPSSTSEV